MLMTFTIRIMLQKMKQFKLDSMPHNVCIVFPLGHRSNYTTKQFLLIKAYMYYNFLRLDEPNLLKVILVGYLSDTKCHLISLNAFYSKRAITQAGISGYGLDRFSNIGCT